MIRFEKDMKCEIRENMRGGKGAVTIHHYFAKEEFTANTRFCAKLIIPSGATIGEHRHDGEDEVYIVVSGHGVLDDGTMQTPIKAGDAILTGNGESHAVANTGDSPLEIVAMIMCY
ncbi:MAG: cupin domain-containing protein [Lentisphaerae bacterium]|nr:cupin domain-containing protein [Lentisphaerota bacterium]